eukprot:TRINITY_DN14580_c0_g1_i1.p1 TRINITY_DN14580_c0_g1~~TRINITY_DN14580_c0_g1_i1.p1  ORF type:complete len:292 (-),score=28.87 TRINITY_DN14580_c0_g1_i1:22-897(-)
MSKPLLADNSIQVRGYGTDLKRDLETARTAYGTRDADASRIAHSTAALKSSESHTSGGEFVKSMIFGGLDGIIEMFVVVAGITGAVLPNPERTMVIIGVASLISDALSMGVGDFLSTRAESQYAAEERARETWECENYMQGEIDEMVELYESKGLPSADAREIVEILGKDRKILVDFMMVEELGILPEEEEASAFKNGLVTFVSFVLFGIIPIAAYIIATVALGSDPRKWIAFMVACLFTGFALVLLGAWKARFTNQKWWQSSLSMLLLGGVAAGAAYGLGVGLRHALHLS